MLSNIYYFNVYFSIILEALVWCNIHTGLAGVTQSIGDQHLLEGRLEARALWHINFTLEI